MARTVWDVKLEHAIRAGWSRWTSDPVDQPGWTAANPASGQCASTALVVQDRLGGELLIADVHEADGSRQGVHYWNRLPGGRELDLTREQFRSGEVVGAPDTVDRPTDVTRGRLAGQYHLLAARVARKGEAAGAAVSVKGVCRDDAGRVLLCRNHRGEWELPGGRPGVGELFHDCLKRELREETALDVAVERVLGVRLLEAVPGAWVDLVAYECAAVGPVALRKSAEHVALAFLEPERLDGLPAAYADLIAACALRPRS
jgi:ADP-ribose pyrophosphatase YjhB (NUDIX family)